MIPEIVCFLTLTLCTSYTYNIAFAQQNNFSLSEGGLNGDGNVSMRNHTNASMMNANPGDASMMNANPGDASMMNANITNDTR